MSISTHSNLQKPSTPKLELSEVKKRGCENALLLCAMKGWEEGQQAYYIWLLGWGWRRIWWIRWQRRDNNVWQLPCLQGREKKLAHFSLSLSYVWYNRLEYACVREKVCRYFSLRKGGTESSFKGGVGFVHGLILKLPHISCVSAVQD